MVTRTTQPRPGTVAALIPPPAPVDEARRLVAEGADMGSAVERLSRSFGADELRDARDWWVRRMPKAAWDDHRASAVLQVIERALARVDGLVTERRPRRSGRKSRA